MAGSGFLIGFLLSFGLVIWVLVKGSNVGDISDVQDAPHDSDRQRDAATGQGASVEREDDGRDEVDGTHRLKVAHPLPDTGNGAASGAEKSLRPADSQPTD